MKSQTYSGNVLWVIVDDGEPVTTDFITDDFRAGWTIQKVYPKPVWQKGQNTQGRNLAAGMREIKKLDPELIFIIEDDDYYSPRYLEEMVTRKFDYDLIGEKNTIYYNVMNKRWCVNGNDKWSSLFQTAFTPAVIPIFEKLYSEKFIDYVLFKRVKKINLFNAGNLGVGIKGQPGRAGIGAGHGYIHNMIPDENMTKLREFIGDDFRYYSDYSRL